MPSRPLNDEKQDKQSQNTDSVNPGVFRYLMSWVPSFFSASDLSTVREARDPMSREEFARLNEKYTDLRSYLKHLRTTYSDKVRAENARKSRSTISWLTSVVTETVKPFVGADYETERYRAIDFIQSVAQTTPDPKLNPFTYTSKGCEQLEIYYQILKGLVHLEKEKIRDSYRATPPENSRLFNMLSQQVEDDTDEQKAFSLKKLHDYLESKSETNFTYTREVTKESTLTVISDFVSRFSPSLSQQMS